MIVCKFADLIRDEGWGRVADLELLAALPREQLEPEQSCLTWKESLIERSLLRRPEVLAKALGVTTPKGILALRQVALIDLYLRVDGGLHLLEMKKPTEHTKWQFAAKQIARQWAKSSVWLRHGNEPVHLWAVCPVRWSRSKGTPKIPTNCGVALAAIKLEQLSGLAAAELSLLFYSIVQSASGRFLILWRADEPPPTAST